MHDKIERLTQNLSGKIVGKADAIQLVLVALLSGGHALLEDVPGVGKTLLAKSLASSIDGKFQRIQCTPDLLPADVTGTNVWNPKTGEFSFLPGPVFANVLLADEINRATPRTQAALLEVMEEQQVTIDGVSRSVPVPFFVLATQNPVEYQGTFPLPEAQMDRFALSLTLGYPTVTEEGQMLERFQNKTIAKQLEPCLSLDDVEALQHDCTEIRVEDSLRDYMVTIVRSTRQDPEINLGVSPRGTVAFYRATQALAFLAGRAYAIPDDVKALAVPVLSHRLIPAGNYRSQAIVERILRNTPIP